MTEPQMIATAYRVGAWNAPTRNTSIADVIRYETDELGNTLTVDPHVDLDHLDTLSSKRALWVVADVRDAARYTDTSQGAAYGDLCRVAFDPPALVVARDGEGGLLVVHGGLVDEIDICTAHPDAELVWGERRLAPLMYCPVCGPEAYTPQEHL